MQYPRLLHSVEVVLPGLKNVFSLTTGFLFNVALLFLQSFQNYSPIQF